MVEASQHALTRVTDFATFQGKDFVYTVKEGKASILSVNIVTFLGNKVGADNPYFVPGMPVVIEGNERLRPDQPVTVEGAN